jgi:hypothetical protein
MFFARESNDDYLLEGWFQQESADRDDARFLIPARLRQHLPGGVAGQAVQKPMASGAGRVAVAYAAYSAWISGQPGS